MPQSTETTETFASCYGTSYSYTRWHSFSLMWLHRYCAWAAKTWSFHTASELWARGLPSIADLSSAMPTASRQRDARLPATFSFDQGETDGCGLMYLLVEVNGGTLRVVVPDLQRKLSSWNSQQEAHCATKKKPSQGRPPIFGHRDTRVDLLLPLESYCQGLRMNCHISHDSCAFCRMLTYDAGSIWLPACRYTHGAQRHSVELKGDPACHLCEAVAFATWHACNCLQRWTELHVPF